MNHTNTTNRAWSFQNNKPYATALLSGSDLAPGLSGTVRLYDAPSGGTIVETMVNGLPPISLPTANPQVGPFGFHIHDGAACGAPTGAAPFSQAGGTITQQTSRIPCTRGICRYSSPTMVTPI